MENAYLEMQILDLDISQDITWTNSKCRILVDNRLVKEISLNKLSAKAKTKLKPNDELVVLQIVSGGVQ